MEKIFDINYAKKTAKGYDLKVTLKKNFKGVSLFAKKPIKKGTVVAYYKFEVHSQKEHVAVKDDMYTISVYTKSGRYSQSVIGDVFKGSLEKPKYNIPFWGYFSNEPSENQRENVYLDVNTKGNYRKRDKVRPGDTMVYKLVAFKDIEPGEEICWCYGAYYVRDYKTPCADE